MSSLVCKINRKLHVCHERPPAARRVMSNFLHTSHVTPLMFCEQDQNRAPDNRHPFFVLFCRATQVAHHKTACTNRTLLNTSVLKSCRDHFVPFSCFPYACHLERYTSMFLRLERTSLKCLGPLTGWPPRFFPSVAQTAWGLYRYILPSTSTRSPLPS